MKEHQGNAEKIALKSTIPFIREWQGTAKADGFEDEWLASHKENIRCRDYIDSPETGLSATAFDGFSVDKDGSYMKNLIGEFGWQRTMCVVASTFRMKMDDGRINSFNKAWAQKEIGDMNIAQYKEYAVSDYTNPGMMDIFARSIQKEYAELGLYTHEQCEPNSYAELDYDNKVLILAPENLREELWNPENQLFYNDVGGNGSHAGAIGRSFVGTYLADGEQCRALRTDFIGVMKDEYIPDWAKEKVEQMQNSEQDAAIEQNNPEENNGMEMNM